MAASKKGRSVNARAVPAPQMSFEFLQRQRVRESAIDRLMSPGAEQRLEQARAEGKRASEAAAKKSGEQFQQIAYDFGVRFFRHHGTASAEDCTEALIAAGLRPKDVDLRAMGNVYRRLVEDGVVMFAGDCARRLGHGTRGGRLYRAVLA